MNLYLCDYTHPSDEQPNWQFALESVFAELFKADGTEKWSEPERRHPAYQDKDAIIFCHSRWAEAAWRKKADAVLCQIVLVRRWGGQVLESNTKGNLHGCHWSPADLLADSRPRRLDRWISQIKVGRVSKIQWALLRPPPTEHLYALKLLCDAWELNSGKPEMAHSGIVINAPTTAVDWFRPFDKNVKEENAEMIAAGIETPHTRTCVKEFLLKVTRNTSVNSRDVGSLKQALDSDIKCMNT